MPRRARRTEEGAHFFHIMVQGIGRNYTFEHDDWKGFYLQCMQKAKKESIKIIAFCVMGNHVHLLLKAEATEGLSEYMRKINLDYSRYYNRENKRIGHVFRDRYRSEPIKDIFQLINCLAFIHNNPVKAGIVGRAEEYKYSSYANYLTGRGLVDSEESAKHFDISKQNIMAMTEEKNIQKWLEHDDKEYERKEDVLAEIIKRYNINTSKIDNDLLRKMAIELHERSGASYREIANILEVSRERLRLLVLSR